MSKQFITTCLLWSMFCTLPTGAKAQDYKNSLRLNVLNFLHKGIGVAYERKTFAHQSISIEYSLVHFFKGPKKEEEEGWVNFSNFRWRWSALILEYRFYLLNPDELKRFNMFVGIYARYATNHTQELSGKVQMMYGKSYQPNDSYKEAKNSMLGGGVTFGYVGQISSRIKIELWKGLGLMSILEETVRDDYANYRNSLSSYPYEPEKRESMRWNPRVGITVGYCFQKPSTNLK